MIFYEADKTSIQIVMPYIEGHIRAICTASQPAQDQMQPLATGAYSLNGPSATASLLKDLIVPGYNLVLQKELVEVDLVAAAEVSAIITVPMPKSVRVFRGSEATGNVFGNTDPGIAFQVPMAFHDVVILSYQVDPKTTISIDGPGGALATAVTVADESINWILSSTDEKPVFGPGLAHPTAALNSLLKIKATGKTTDFSLSAIGAKDAFLNTGTGISRAQLSAYHELPATNMGNLIDLNCSDDGCTSISVGSRG